MDTTDSATSSPDTGSERLPGCGAAAGETAEERLARYRSSRFDDAQHARFATRISELVLAVPPSGPLAARVMASHLSRFVADLAGEHPDAGVDDLLTESRVAVWCARTRGGDLSDGSLSQTLATLRKALRVKEGLPGRKERPTAARRAAPTVDAALLFALCAEDVQATAALTAAIGAGLVARSAVGAVFVEHDSGIGVELADGRRIRVRDTLAHHASRLVGVRVTTAAWERLRDTGRAAGVTVDAREVRDAWLIATLDETDCRGALAAASHGRLDWAAPHLAAIDPDRMRRALRG
jgi:hypothetical protein